MTLCSGHDSNATASMNFGSLLAPVGLQACTRRLQPGVLHPPRIRVRCWSLCPADSHDSNCQAAADRRWRDAPVLVASVHQSWEVAASERPFVASQSFGYRDRNPCHCRSPYRSLIRAIEAWGLGCQTPTATAGILSAWKSLQNGEPLQSSCKKGAIFSARVRSYLHLLPD